MTSTKPNTTVIEDLIGKKSAYLDEHGYVRKVNTTGNTKK